MLSTLCPESCDPPGISNHKRLGFGKAADSMPAMSVHNFVSVSCNEAIG